MFAAVPLWVDFAFPFSFGGISSRFLFRDFLKTADSAWVTAPLEMLQAVFGRTCEGLALLGGFLENCSLDLSLQIDYNYSY